MLLYFKGTAYISKLYKEQLYFQVDDLVFSKFEEALLSISKLQLTLFLKRHLKLCIKALSRKFYSSLAVVWFKMSTSIFLILLDIWIQFKGNALNHETSTKNSYFFKALPHF